MSRKFLTRKEIRYWFQPITDFIRKAKQEGELDSVKGWPITYIATRKVWGPVHTVMSGFRESVERMAPNFDFSLFHTIEHKLEHGEMLTQQEVDSLQGNMNTLESLMVKIPQHQILDAVRTTMIAIELRNLK